VAGIGFELQRALKGGGISALVKVAFAGIMIVAGPWLLAIVGIFLVGRFAGFALVEHRALFMAVIVYSYAFSLFLLGGTHYIFTRYVADVIYEEKDRVAGSALVIFSGVTILISTAIAFPMIMRVDLGSVSRPWMFRLSAVLFFVVVNTLWIEMIFISLLKKYTAIFLTYLSGMTVSVVGVLVLGRLYALGGAMLGFVSGQFLTALILGIMALVSYRPGSPGEAIRGLISYVPRYLFLFLAGLFYNWGIWIDKIIYWFLLGTPIEGTPFRLFDTYDISVYLANLSMIPGLIYFVVVSETDFYIQLKEFLSSLSSAVYYGIRDQRDRLIRELRRGLREQTTFQGVLTAVLVLLAPSLLASLGLVSVEPTILRLTLAAVFFHFVFLTLMTFLFYIEAHGYACLSALVLFLVNAGATVGTVQWQIGNLYGASYLLGSMVACGVAAAFLLIRIRVIDRTIYARYCKV
jgi:uncharacterized membrane protein